MAQKNKEKIPKNLLIKCNAIIHGASLVSATACGLLAQFPLSDNTVLTPLQVAMIASIAKVFGQNIGKGAAQGILSAFAATLAGRGITQVVVGWVPGVGNAVNSITAAALTETIGWMAADLFAEDYHQNNKNIRAAKCAQEEKKVSSEHTKSTDSPEIGLEKWKDDVKKQAQDMLSNQEPDIAVLDELVGQIEDKLDILPVDDPIRELYLKLLRKRVC